MEELVRRHNPDALFPTFPAWLPKITPTWTWDWAYQQHIQGQLQRVTSGEIDRLMLFVPPRHGKSEMTTVRYSMWRLEREPTLRIILGAYNQTLSEKFSRKCRRIARERMVLSTERNAAEDWETVQGGGVRAVGVGGGITGQGGDLIVIDDPVKNREEAESLTYREKVWDWYTDDLYTRLEPGGQMILIMTRWHEDDLAGRILASEDAPNWVVVSLPAEAEEGDPIGREIGAPLCPARYDKEALADRRRVLGPYGYGSLFQQQPRPREGGYFRAEWFEIVDAAPAVAQKVRWWDMAASQGEGDYTVGLLMSRANGVYYIEDVRRGQYSAHAAEQIVKQTAQMDGRGLRIWMEQEPGSSGKAVIASYVRLLQGYPFRGKPSTGNKELRADPFAAQCEAGNVKLVKGAWNREYIEELTMFPNGAHDDQVDASSGAFGELAIPAASAPAAGGERTAVTQFRPI